MEQTKNYGSKSHSFFSLCFRPYFYWYIALTLGVAVDTGLACFLFSVVGQYYSIRRSVSKNRLINIHNVIRRLCCESQRYTVLCMTGFLRGTEFRMLDMSHVKSIGSAVKIFATCGVCGSKRKFCRLFDINLLEISVEIDARKGISFHGIYGS